MKLDAKIPAGPLAQKWDQHRFALKLINPANKRKHDHSGGGDRIVGGVRRGDAGRAGL